MASKRWIPKQTPESSKVDELAAAININKTLAGVLVQRGVDNFEIAKKRMDRVVVRSKVLSAYGLIS